MWKEGTIGVPTDNGKYIAVHYTAKVYDEPSDFGINCGRISKLTLKQDGKFVYNYDRGLDLDCQTEEAEVALAILLKEYE